MVYSPLQLTLAITICTGGKVEKMLLVRRSSTEKEKECIPLFEEIGHLRRSKVLANDSEF